MKRGWMTMPALASPPKSRVTGFALEEEEDTEHRGVGERAHRQRWLDRSALKLCQRNK